MQYRGLRQLFTVRSIEHARLHILPKRFDTGPETRRFPAFDLAALAGVALLPSTREGFALAAAGDRYAVTVSTIPAVRAPVERGCASLLQQELPDMPLHQAQRRALDLARTLLVEILIIEFDDHSFGVLEARDFDGNPEAIVTSYDPFPA